MPTPQPSIEVLAADDHANGLPVVIGVPLTRGMARDTANLTVTSPSGKPCPAATRALNHWPDGSARWVLFTLLAKERGTHRIGVAKSRPPAPAIHNPVRFTQAADTATLDNGLVQVVLGLNGPGPLRRIAALGHAYLADANALRFSVNDADTTREQARTIQVLENSPLRVRVRLSGAHFRADGSRLFTYRLDAELWAGWPSLRLDYHFFHVEPGKQHEEIGVNRIGMDWRVDLGSNKGLQHHFLQTYYDTMYVPREVFNPARVALVSDDLCGTAHVEDPAMLMDEIVYPTHLRPPLIFTPEWLGVGNGQRALYARMTDFLQMRPKRLAADAHDLTWDIWPATTGRLMLPQGRSRRQSLTLTFSEGGWLKPAQIDSRLGAPQHEGRAVVTPEWLRHTGEFELDRCMAPGASVRFEKFMARLVNLESPQDMFHLGDTIDSSYCRTYLPIPNNSTLKPNAPALPRLFTMTGAHHMLAETSMPQFYEPVWTNNEYDAIFAFCTEIMRTGRGDLWQMARWQVRHNIEVDFLHYHDDLQQNRATPQHSMNHNRSGAIPSHFWTQGLLQYYCLTGDPDVLEVATALGDKIIEDFTVPALRQSFWTFTRELGWPMLALAHLVDITGEKRFARQLDEVIEYFMNYKRPPGFDRALVPGLWAWSCVFEGADLYQRRTGRKDIAHWLEQFITSECKELLQLHEEGKSVTLMAASVMAIGHERMGGQDFLRAGLACIEEFMDTPWWMNTPREIKPMAMTYRGLVRYLHHAAEAGLLKHLEFSSVRPPRNSRPRKQGRAKAAPRTNRPPGRRGKKVSRG